MKQGDVNIDVHQNRLTISGEFKSEFAPDDPGYVVKERPHDKFSRSINLPAGVKVGSHRLSMTRLVLISRSAGGCEGQVGERSLDYCLSEGDSRARAKAHHCFLNASMFIKAGFPKLYGYDSLKRIKSCYP